MTFFPSRYICYDGIRYYIFAAIFFGCDINLTDEQLKKLIRKAGVNETPGLVKRPPKNRNLKPGTPPVMLAAAVCSPEDGFSSEEIGLITSVMDQQRHIYNSMS